MNINIQRNSTHNAEAINLADAFLAKYDDKLKYRPQYDTTFVH